MMQSGVLIAIVTTNPDAIKGGGAPIIIAKDKTEMERLSLLISRMTQSAIHDLENDINFLYRH